MYTGPADADVVAVVMGAATGPLVECLSSVRGAGVLRVVLYRPFSRSLFISSLSGPLQSNSLRHVVVLDRSHESGSCGDPLFLDVCAALALSGALAAGVRVIGGRYGLGDKAFTPAMAAAVLRHARSGGRSDFVVGIEDDCTGRSIQVPVEMGLGLELGLGSGGETRQCVLWGLGSDGTVGATKQAASLISASTSLFVQGLFFFTAHKAGGVTVSHLRFGSSHLMDSTMTYPILDGTADYVACHAPSYASRYSRALCASLRPGADFVINWPGGAASALSSLPASLRAGLAAKRARVYAVDARAVARAAGLGGNIINVVMLVALFRVAVEKTGKLEVSVALELLKKTAAEAYAKKGPDVVKKNCQAIDLALAHVAEVVYSAPEWLTAAATATATAAVTVTATAQVETLSQFVANVKAPVDDMRGDSLPVSAFVLGGAIPTGTAAYEKRGISDTIPLWDSKVCVQCCNCSVVCPHAAIRPFLVTAEEGSRLTVPVPMATAKGLGPDLSSKLGPGGLFRIQVSSLDCTGCGVCVSVCPAKGALVLHRDDTGQAIKTEAENWAAMTSQVAQKSSWVPDPKNVKLSQMRQPLFEFSSACAGCGEAGYIKLLTQLVGERLAIANAPGCSSAIAVSFASTPYTTASSSGWGPSLRAALFENNAEHGFGMERAGRVQRDRLAEYVREILSEPSSKSLISKELSALLTTWLSCQGSSSSESTSHMSPDSIKELWALLESHVSTQQSSTVLQSTQAALALRDAFVDVSLWILGGDGWAYDINSGGLDHVLSTDSRVRILMLDTEVYSNTGGQVSKATPEGGVHKFAAGGKSGGKKDLAMQSVALGHVYVACVSLYASPFQTLRALREAEQFEGPSLVLAYAPCIEHGIEGGTLSFVAHAKLATESGYWPLFRYDPRKKPAMQLDSAEPTKSPMELLEKENRFTRLARENPERAKMLNDRLVQRVLQRWETLKIMAKQ
jgi:pyruvate-ferredoxin/flavodoxin oxidoreductase